MILVPGRSAVLIHRCWKAFETALKDVVNAKQLSQTKMNTLTGVALKCMKVRYCCNSHAYEAARMLHTAAHAGLT